MVCGAITALRAGTSRGDWAGGDDARCVMIIDSITDSISMGGTYCNEEFIMRNDVGLKGNVAGNGCR
jgi:hypothetical protein